MYTCTCIYKINNKKIYIYINMNICNAKRIAICFVGVYLFWGICLVENFIEVNIGNICIYIYICV